MVEACTEAFRVMCKLHSPCFPQTRPLPHHHLPVSDGGKAIDGIDCLRRPEHASPSQKALELAA
jgi:hypothetical protein